MTADAPEAQLPTDLEIDRSLNALSVTFNDQRQATGDVQRAQQIVDGALGGEHKIQVRGDGPDGVALHAVADGRRLATVRRRADGRWIADRDEPAERSHVAVPGRQRDG